MVNQDSCTWLDDDRPSSSSSSTSSSSPDHLQQILTSSMTKSNSYSRLNARALSFIPRSNSTSSINFNTAGLTSPRTILTPRPPPTTTTATTTQQTSFLIPQPPGPPTLVHVYTTTTTPTGTATLIVPVQQAYHVPVQYNTQFIGGQQREVVALTVVPPPPMMAATVASPVNIDSNSAPPSEEVSQKILNQVEYYFSDINVATTDLLLRFMNKDSEGYVPISVVASFKKIKALVNCHVHLANILRKSEKLVVSEDGKRVKRMHHLTKSDMDELQSRIVIAENLPEDHCHQNLMKIFSAVGSVKTIRTCQPQATNGAASPATRAKAEGLFFSNKLHAFVEYETFELAEKAVHELNDEKNWRNGLKLRLMNKPKTKVKDIDVSTPECTLHSDVTHESSGEEHGHDGEQKKASSYGRGKGRGRGQYYPPTRGIMGPTPIMNGEHPIIHKQQPSVPRMPDGSRGFSLGRGKQIAI